MSEVNIAPFSNEQKVELLKSLKVNQRVSINSFPQTSSDILNDFIQKHNKLIDLFLKDFEK